ncbi:MAG: bacterial Ig-like domain-containing protein, partial [Treponema sp.]|nr:bacterial Ig-like domain-containing protein [Treponema sp.]
MKNTIKLFGIIAITAVIGILASCASMTLVAIDTIEGPRQVRQGDDITPRDIVVYGLYKNGDRKVISNITASNITFDKNAVGPQTVRVRSGSQAGSFQTEVMALVSLTITSQLTNTSIRQGQEMNSWPGLAVQGEWDQMGTQNIPIPSLEITGYNGDRVGSQVITISYLGKTASFNVDVKALRSIQITQPPAKVDYFQGESLNLAGLQVTGQWDGLPDELIPLTRITTSGLPANVGQQQRVTVTVSGQTANFFVNVAVGQLVW